MDERSSSKAIGRWTLLLPDLFCHCIWLCLPSDEFSVSIYFGERRAIERHRSGENFGCISVGNLVDIGQALMTQSTLWDSARLDIERSILRIIYSVAMEGPETVRSHIDQMVDSWLSKGYNLLTTPDSPPAAEAPDFVSAFIVE